jgi:hypothetical protein
MSITDNEPNVLVIYYNENGDYASEHDDIKKQIIDKINPFNQGTIIKNHDFIFLCTQKSLSSTKDHMQHVIGEELKKPGSQYTLFSKIDATRPSNSSAWRLSKDSKFKNVRVRCWRNINIKKPLKIQENKLEEESYRCSKNSFINEYNSSKIVNTNVVTPTTQYLQIPLSDIKIKRYQYKRITEQNENSRKNGFGAIIVSLILEKEGKEYKYIICNYNFKNNLKYNIVNKIYNSQSNVDNLYISAISQENIITKYIKKNEYIPFSNIINKNKNINLVNNNVYFIQLSRYISSTDLILLIKNIKENLKNNITRENINKLNLNVIKGSETNYDYIVSKLIYYLSKSNYNSNNYNKIEDLFNFWNKIQ